MDMSGTEWFRDALQLEIEQSQRHNQMLRDMVPLADAILDVLRGSSVIPCTDCDNSPSCRIDMRLECDLSPIAIVVQRCGWDGAVVQVLCFDSYPTCAVTNHRPAHRRIFHNPRRVQHTLNPLLASLEFKRRVLALVLSSRHTVTLPPELYEFVFTEFLS